MSFGEKLKELRLKKGLSQIKLEKELGLWNGNNATSNFIFKYEKGLRKPSLETLQKIENYFNYKFKKSDTEKILTRFNHITKKQEELVEVQKTYIDLLLNDYIKNGYSKSELAELIGINKAVLYNVLRGQKRLTVTNYELIENFIKSVSKENIQVINSITKLDDEKMLFEIVNDIEEFNSMPSGHRLALYAIKHHMDNLHGEIDKFFTDVLSETEKFIMLKALLEYKFGSRPNEKKIREFIEKEEFETAKLGLIFMLNNINAQYKDLI